MPEIQDITIDDVLADGKTLGLPTEEIAGAVKRWRDMTHTWATDAVADPETYRQGTHELDQLAALRLADLRKEHAQSYLKTLEPTQVEALLTDTDAASLDEQLNSIAANPAYQLPRRDTTPLQITDPAGNQLATFQPLTRPDGKLDLVLNYQPKDQEAQAARLTMDPVTPEEIASELDRSRKDAVHYEAEANKPWNSTLVAVAGPGGAQAAAGGQIADRQLATQKRDEALRRIAALEAPGAANFRLVEKTAETLKAHPELKNVIGDKDFGGDFYRGLANFYMGSRVAWNDLTGDAAERDEHRAVLNALPQAIPGSTNRRFQGGMQAFAMDAVEGLGGMTPQILAAVATGGAGLANGAARAALTQGGGLTTAATLGSMGAASYGSAVSDALDRASALEAKAESVELPFTEAQRQAMRTQAASIRDNYRAIATTKAAVEVGTELILPEHKLLLKPGSLGGNLAKSAAEGGTAEFGNQVVNQGAYGDRMDAGNIARAAALETVVAAPLLGSNALIGLAGKREENLTPQNSLRSRIAAQVANSQLVGTVPPGAEAYGIKEGTAEEWTNYLTSLAHKESSGNPATVGDHGRFGGHGSRGLFQLSPDDAVNYKLQGSPFTYEQLHDPDTNIAAAIKIHEQRLASGQPMREAIGAYWGPVKRGWTPTASDPDDADLTRFHAAQDASFAVNAAEPAPESLGELQRQHALTRAGKRAATLVPGLTAAHLPSSLYDADIDADIGALDTPDGTLLYNRNLANEDVLHAALAENSLGTLLGYGTADRPAKPDRAVSILNAQGAAVVSVEAHAESEVAHTQAFQKLLNEGDTIITEPRETALARRAAERQTESRLANPVRPRTITDVARNAGKRLQFSNPSALEFVDWETARARIQNGSVAGRVELGMISQQTVQQAKSLGLDLSDTRVNFRLDAWKHADKKHGSGSSPEKEISKHPDQEPLTERDLDKIPAATLAPDAIGMLVDPAQLRRAGTDLDFVPEKETFSLIGVKEINGQFIVALTLPNKHGVANFRTAYKRKARPGVSAEDVLQEILQDNASKAGRTRSLNDITRLWQRRQELDRKGPQPRLQPSRTRITAQLRDPKRAAYQAAEILNQRLPGIVTPKTRFFNDATDLIASGYASAQSFTEAELESMQDAEGFYDQQTGHTVIFLDQIDIRPGESERAAVARVILHERVGHDGMNALLADPKFAAAWDALRSKIPPAELDALRPDYAALDDTSLALEWFARQVEAKEDSKFRGLTARVMEAFKAFYARAFRHFSKSLQTETDIRDLIAKARKAAQNGTAVPATAADLAHRIQLSLPAKNGTPFRVQNLGRRALLTGSPLPKAFREVTQATQREQAALDSAFARNASGLEAESKAAAKTSGLPLSDIYTQVNAALDSSPGAMAALQAAHPELAEWVRRGRNMIDDLSLLIADTLPAGDARNAVIANMGHWLRRSYQAFDKSADWNYDSVYKAAILNKTHNGQDARRILQDATRYLLTQDPSRRGQTQAGLPKPGSELEADMRDLMDRDSWASALVPSGGPKPRKNVTSLQQRKDIDPEIRALMGEHTNPLHRFTVSASFQTQFIAKHHGLQAMRTLGLASGIFTTARAGVFTQQIPESHAWSPVANLWTTPQLWEALQTANAHNKPEGMLAAFKAITAHAKLNNVALNPKSTMTNIIGGVVASVQTGDIFAGRYLERWNKAAAAVASGKAKPGELRNIALLAHRDTAAQCRAELISRGILGADMTLAEFHAANAPAILTILGHDDKSKAFMSRALGAAQGAALGNALGRAVAGGQIVGVAIGATAGAVVGHERISKFHQAIADLTMTKPDAMVKVMAYYSQLRTAKLSGQANPEAWAADRVRNTYPTYDKVPEWLRQLSLLPVLGNFVAFSYEVPRNMIWNLKYAFQDIRSADPALRADGARRLAGAAAVQALAFSLPTLGHMFLGYEPPEDERQKLFREHFAADYEKDATLTFKKFDANGATYFNHAYLIPQAALADFAKAAAANASEGEIAKLGTESVTRLLAYFGWGNNLANTLVEAYLNRDKFDRPIAADPKTAEGRAQRLDYASKTYAEPGYAKLAADWTKAINAADQPTVTRLENAIMGVRDRSLTWDKAVIYRYNALNTAAQNVKDTLRRSLQPQNRKIGQDNNQVLAEVNAKLAAIARQAHEFEADTKTLGIPAATVSKARKESGWPKTLYTVEIDPADPTKYRSTKTPAQP